MPSRQSRYEVRISNTSGVLQAVLIDWISLSYSLRVNEPGSFTLILGDYDPALAALFVEDALVEVWRRPSGITPYIDFEGFHRDISRKTDAKGMQTLQASGPGYLDLIDRRIIAYPANTPQTEKRGAAGTVIWQFVDENAGPSATVVNGREASGVTTGLTLAADGGLGSAWEGARAWDSLLTVIQGISAQVTDVEFAVVGTGSGTFEFRLYSRIGTDHSFGTGADAVVFARNLGNMGEANYNRATSRERNRAIVLGPGEELDRVVVTVNDAAAQALSPWATAEVSRQATQEKSVLALTNTGARVLEETKAFEEFAFTPIETDGTRYGVNYVLGDTVTARYDANTEVDLRIIGVDVNVANGVETINLAVRTVR